ncbi:unnamed protein product [Amaranthus hypochondriacus]
MKIVFLFILLSLLSTLCFAVKQSYVVYFGAHNHGPEVSLEDLDRVQNSHHNFLASYLGSYEEAKEAIFYSYKRHINGFAAVFDEKHAAEIAKDGDVVSVFPNRGRMLHTSHSWDFMQLEKNGVINKNSIWKRTRFGEDTIIANLDTGVWPESKSFSDEGYGPVPARWKGGCEHRNGGVRCNRKLIGARHFKKGYIAAGNKVKNSADSPRDFEGHGSHTLSTAGGNFVSKARILGYVDGTVKGGSPKARLAAYKVCWPGGDTGGCFDADILAAFDTAIDDGVDVISLSVGGEPIDYVNDGIAIGAFHAVQKGIVVVCSAGNSGPTQGTVTNVAPWLLTVAASTIDREFRAFVLLPNGKRLKGSSLSGRLPQHRLYPLISATRAKASNTSIQDALLCKPGTLDKTKVQGKILVCVRGQTDRVDKGRQALLAGAVGMILCNDESSANDIVADLHVLPASHLTFKDCKNVFAYLNSTKDAYGFITPPTTKIGTKPAPYMAAFSSKGPNTITPEILKPDITAPGVNIIAAYSEAANPTEESWDKRRASYMVVSGTSMSCPHISGVVGLLKTLHTTWSVAAIRSAIMTTARTRDNTMHPMMNSSYIKSNPFEYGAGHVRPNRAMNPGLIYDLTTSDYLNFLCALGYNNTLLSSFDASHKCTLSKSSKPLVNMNYPSITVPKLSGSITVTRTVTNVGKPGTYSARVRQPLGVEISVSPTEMKFKKYGEKKRFKVSLKVKNGGLSKGYEFGELLWSDGKHYVRSPIVVDIAH